MDPWDKVVVDSPDEFAPHIADKLNERLGSMLEMTNISRGRTQLVYQMATRAFMGLHSWIGSLTGGQAVVYTEFLELRKRDLKTEWRKKRNPVFVHFSRDIRFCNTKRFYIFYGPMENINEFNFNDTISIRRVSRVGMGTTTSPPSIRRALKEEKTQL